MSASVFINKIIFCFTIYYFKVTTSCITIFVGFLSDKNTHQNSQFCHRTIPLIIKNGIYRVWIKSLSGFKKKYKRRNVPVWLIPSLEV